MAAKHDGKRAAANFWVAQQNLAKSKGGRPLYQPKQPKPREAPVAPLEIRKPAAEAPTKPE